MMIEGEPKIETKAINTCNKCKRNLSNLSNGIGMEYLKRKRPDNQFEIITTCRSCATHFISEENYEWYASHPFRKSMVKFPLRSRVIPR